MTNEITLFNHPDFGSVGAIIINDAPWLPVADVYAGLRLSDPSNATKVLDADEVMTYPVQYTDQVRNILLMSEARFYATVFRSRKPEAKAFKRWVTHEVLPQIRATGSFGDTTRIFTELHQFLQDEREARVKFQASVMEHLTTRRETKPVSLIRYEPTPADLEERIFMWLKRAGTDGVARRTISNRIRLSLSRQTAIDNLLASGKVVEMVQNGKRYFFLASAFPVSTDHS